MNNLVTEVTLKAMLEFFIVGAFCGCFYYFVTLFVSLIEIFVSKAGMTTLAKGSFKELFSLMKTNSVITSHPIVGDVFRALFILTVGFIVAFMNYALTDGIPRIYTIASAMLGILFTQTLFKSYLGYAVRIILAQCITFVATVVSFPARILMRVIFQNRKKSDIIP